MEIPSPSTKRQKVIDLSVEESVAAKPDAVDVDDDDDDDDEVQIVEPPPSSFAAVTPEQVVNKPSSSRTKNHDDDDIQVVGTVNTVVLPHMRPHCTVYPFNKQTLIDLATEDEDEAADDSSSDENPNRQYCSLCYCYVCDVPAKDCNEWNESHCNASDKSPYWKRKRRGKRMGSFNVRFENALLFKKLIFNLKQMENDAYIVCSGDDNTESPPPSSSSSSSCFQMYAANGPQTGIVRVKIPRKDFAEYLCSSSQQQERICVRVDYDDLQAWASMLQKARKLDVIILNMKDGELHIQMESPKGLKVPDPIQIPVQVDKEKTWFITPDCEIKCFVRMPSARFKQYISFLIRDMGSSGAEFHCDAKSKKVILQGNRSDDDLEFGLLSPTGYIQKARFHITEAQKDTCVVVDAYDTANATFKQTLDAFYLHAFFKTAAVSSVLKIYLTQDMSPCEFRYESDPDSSAESTTLSFVLGPGLDPMGADDNDDDSDDDDILPNLVNLYAFGD